MTQKIFKKILVPVAFNRNTGWTIRKAVQLANKFRCDLFLLHVQSPPAIPFLYDGTLPFPFPVRSLESLERKMKGLTQLASQRLDDGLQLCSEIRHGNWPGILKETIIAEQVDLVVIPKGRRRISDALLNRINISRLVQQSGCTALMVTRSFNAHHMENIVVPVHGILPVKKLVAATYVSMESNGHIYLMGNENRLRGQDQDSLFKAYHLLSEYSRCRVHCALKESDDVAGNTLAFAKDVKANLIVVEANGEAGLKGWWNRMLGRQLYGESDIPVLTVAH